MLLELAVRDLGVIPELRLVLGPGMTAVTGETGAGKTMVVDAIELLVGGRADPMLVRTGASEAWVEGRFLRPFDPDRDGEPGEVVLSRAIPRTGRSRAYIDGRLATVGELAALGAVLVDLHGQHAHQSLLHPAAQRESLDRFGGVDLDPLRGARYDVAHVVDELTALGGDERARARELDLVRYQVDEIDAAALEGPDEDDAARGRGGPAGRRRRPPGRGRRGARPPCPATATGRRTARPPPRTLSARRWPQWRAGPRSATPRPACGRWRPSSPTSPPSCGPRASPSTRTPPASTRCASAASCCTTCAASTGTRWPTSWPRASACGPGWPSWRTTTAGRPSSTPRSSRPRKVEAAAAAVVAEARRAAAPELARRIQANLTELAMPKAQVAIEVRGDDPGDDVEVLLAANPGTPPLPLAKVASGGELARTMLALRLVLTGAPPTLVFDEVDAGIGGTAALAVGRSLARLAGEHQVLVVTHLPQVAAYADAQVRVAKQSDEAATVSHANVLDQPERVIELSRMLSGQPDSDAARTHAAELLDSAAGERGR